MTRRNEPSPPENRDNPPEIPRVGVMYSGPDQKAQAEQLAHSLGISIVSGEEQLDFILNCTNEGLELFCRGNPLLTGSLRVDFVRGPAGYRRRKSGDEMLIRASGHKKNRQTTVFDATGGLGRDAFIMAASGCRVHLVERSPLVGALVRDGLDRAAQHPQTKEIVARMRLTIGDSRQVVEELGRSGGRWDVIYLDPMFPKRSKAAKVKKELQILQLLVGRDDAPEQLFAAAQQAGPRRIVVKRPRAVPPLPGPRPSHSHSGRTTRFDVYILPQPGK